MRKFSLLLFIILAIPLVIVVGNTYRVVLAQAQGQKAGPGFAAIAGAKGGQDIFGPYDVVAGWPKDISTVPGNEKWTYGARQSVYAKSPNRVFMRYSGELPNIKRTQTKLLSEFGTSIQFPIDALPFLA